MFPGHVEECTCHACLTMQGRHHTLQTNLVQTHVITKFSVPASAFQACASHTHTHTHILRAGPISSVHFHCACLFSLPCTCGSERNNVCKLHMRPVSLLAQASRQPKVAPGTKRSRQTFPLGHGSPCAWTWFGASLAARLLWGDCGSGPSLGKSDGRLSWRGLPGRQLQHRHHYPAGPGSHQFMGS